MCIYCTTTNYRKIYEHHHGSIPVDAQGRTYEIHHIDGDHNNNNPSNLQAVSIEKHLEIHMNQQDWAAASAVMLRMSQDTAERSAFLSENNRKRIENGVHHFAGPTNPSYARVKDGTHHFIGGEVAKNAAKQRVANGTHNFQGSENNLKRIAEGRHPFVGGSIQRDRLIAGTHQNQRFHVCPHCGKSGKGPTMLRHHFDRCKAKDGLSCWI